MASLKYMHSNMAWDQMLKVICYDTQHIQKLSKKQLVTRLYHNVLRFNYAVNMPSVGIGNRLYKEQVDKYKRDFNYMLTLPSDSIELRQYLDKYEKWMENNYEPTMLTYNIQPYGANSNKVWIWSDEVR
jgi:hypothetical protein